ncbi:pilus assembly protein [Luteimicrobium sp. NPDC057192]|uniref:pilus assembly protein n=1 Tax=Luteimicrobium sp. NPDC057192 TaxID=3346042 RepID=UPI0036302B85
MRGAREDGSALVEFLGASLVLLVPLVYLVLTVGRVQAATFAAESAASGAARVFVMAPDQGSGTALAVDATRLAFADQHVPLGDPAGAVSLACLGGACGTSGTAVVARVRVEVTLPMVPAFVRTHVPLAVPVEATAHGTFPRYVDLSGW